MDPAIPLLFIGAALAASVFSIRLEIHVAIFKTVLGMLLGDLGRMNRNDYERFVFLVALGSLVPANLAGAERIPMGNVSMAVSRKAACSVITVRT